MREAFGRKKLRSAQKGKGGPEKPKRKPMKDSRSAPTRELERSMDRKRKKSHVKSRCLQGRGERKMGVKDLETMGHSVRGRENIILTVEMRFWGGRGASGIREAGGEGRGIRKDPAYWRTAARGSWKGRAAD